MARPDASVIVPFAGSQAELEELVARLAQLATRDGDEVIVADNRRAPSPPQVQAPVRWVDARGPRTPYHARNHAAVEARGEWLVFTDADCEPDPGLLDALLDPPPEPDVAILAGRVVDRAQAATACARYVAARRKMSQELALRSPAGPYAQTACAAIRRSAFEQAGGFAGDVRSGGDADLCWRLQAAGWRLEERPEAVVGHRARERYRDLLAQLARHGGGLAWLQRRHPGSAPPPGLRDLAGRFPHYLRGALRARRAGDREEAEFQLADLAALCARDLGRLHSNRARP